MTEQAKKTVLPRVDTLGLTEGEFYRVNYRKVAKK